MLKILHRKLQSARIRWHRAHSFGIDWFGGAFRPVFEQKHLLTATLRGAGLATVTDLARVRAHRVDILDAAHQDTAEPLAPEDCFSNLPVGRYFIKPVVGEHGRDAGCLVRTDSGFEFNGQTIDASQLISRFAANEPGFLIQRWQDQHSGLAQFSADTLNTLRILTLRRGQSAPRVLHAVLRVGRSGAWLDNFHAGGIALHVDLLSGRTIGPAVRLDRSETYTHHPDNGLALDEQRVPEFAAACALVCRAHALFAEIPTVGWDVAIAPEGPCVVEANLDWDTEIHAFVDPGFRAMLSQQLKRTE